MRLPHRCSRRSSRTRLGGLPRRRHCRTGVPTTRFRSGDKSCSRSAKVACPMARPDRSFHGLPYHNGGPLRRYLLQGVRIGVGGYPADGRVRRRPSAPRRCASHPARAAPSWSGFRANRSAGAVLPGEPPSATHRLHRRQRVLAPLAAAGTSANRSCSETQPLARNIHVPRQGSSTQSFPKRTG